MNKKTYITKARLDKIENWLNNSIKWLKENDQGCCSYKLLGGDLALYCGWEADYDVNDKTVIHSKSEPEYAIVVGVKVRNDFDCSDYQSLNFPCYEDGECWDCSLSIHPHETRRDTRRNIRWLLENFVDMTNAYNKGELCYE